MTSPTGDAEVLGTDPDEVDALHSPGSPVAPLLTLTLGIAVIISARTLPEPGLSSDPGPGALPQIVGIGLVIFSVFLLWHREAHERLPRGGGAVRVVATLVFALAYILSLRSLGFLVATTLFLMAEMALIGIRRPVVVIPMAVLMSAGVYVLFRYGLEVPLPATRIGSVTL